MNEPISEKRALEIVDEFARDILREESGIIAIYLIGSLGGGYYRPGQSDIDTVIIVRDDAKISQERMDEIANHYYEEYHIPKGFGSVMIRESELRPPYTKSITEEFEFTVEIARLKVQGTVFWGHYPLDEVIMPGRADFIADALIMERWFSKEFGYPMFDKLAITGCVNTILSYLRRHIIIAHGIFDFNKFTTIKSYLAYSPPLVHDEAFAFIEKKLGNETDGDDTDLGMLRKCGIAFRDYFNRSLLGTDSQDL